MDARTRVRMSMEHEEPDRVPAFESTFTNNALMRYHGLKVGDANLTIFKILPYIPFVNRLLKWGLRKPKIVALGVEDMFKLYRRAKLDLCPTASALFPQKMIKGGFIDEFGRKMKMERYEKDGTLIMGYYGGTFKDFNDYESTEQPDPFDESRLAMFRGAKKFEERMNGEVCQIPFTTGMMEVTWEGFGIENFSRLLAKRRKIKKVFDDRGKFAVEVVKRLGEEGAEFIGVYDDYGYKADLFMAPRNYRKYVIPWLKRICDAAHKHDAKLMLHSDGNLMKIMDDIVEAGVDALNPIEPTTANPDYNIFNLKELYGDRLTFAGNISPQMLSTGSIEDIEAYSKRLLTEVAKGGGYIFSSGHSINPAVTPDRWQAVLDTREKYGYYKKD